MTDSAGWLLKSGKHLLWNFKWRWVVVDHGTIIWYVNKEDQKPSGSLALLLVKDVRLSTALNRAHCIEIIADGSVTGEPAAGGARKLRAFRMIGRCRRFGLRPERAFSSSFLLASRGEARLLH